MTRGADLVAEHQVRFPVAVLLGVHSDDLDEPTRQRQRPAAGRRVRVALEPGVPATSTRVRITRAGRRQVDRVGASCRGLTPVRRYGGSELSNWEADGERGLAMGEFGPRFDRHAPLVPLARCQV